MKQKTPDKLVPAKGETREQRLKAALKANMAKRKAQMRARTQADGRGEKDKGQD
ncbi:hypothetical protein [Thalassovita taeanensis]|uniref:Uncharacterized protein n=1 Tax=Thalassovita taeanensis TaxID=657014 RepID=A0A1H9G637_9RHOB|nr:hypothetical protein [Thalassovita taeanensis]SEQ45480.1 hypothetical protein SAMN04488092_10750 [Thalassovita taeanensis]